MTPLHSLARPGTQRAILLLWLALLTACSGVPIGSRNATATPVPTVTPTTPPTATLAGSPIAQATRRATATTTMSATMPASTPARTGAATNAASPARATSAATASTLPNTTPDAAAALVEQAIAILLEQYVEPLKSDALFGVAFDTVVAQTPVAGPGAPPIFGGNPTDDTARFRRAYLERMAKAGTGVSQTAVAYAAIGAVTTWLDECHTNFLDPEQYQAFTASLEGTQTYGGIGVSIRTQQRPVTIGQIYPNTPAERAGLREGDAIVAVDGVDVRELSYEQVGPLVRGKPGTQVTLTIQRPGEAAPRDVTMTRAEIAVPVFNYRVVDGPNGTKIGYMQLFSFSQGAEGELDKALAEFKRQGVSGWVLDLRDNGGGYLDTLAAIAGRFLDAQPLGYTIVRNGAEEPLSSVAGSLATPQRPLAVLINGGSASSSEAFAAAMQDTGRARLFGETTAGCLAGALTYPLADGSAVSVTIEKIVSPKRREINRAGVQPDSAFPAEPGATRDLALDAAVAWVAAQR